jgi:hypothetical protein
MIYIAMYIAASEVQCDYCALLNPVTPHPHPNLPPKKGKE